MMRTLALNLFLGLLTACQQVPSSLPLCENSKELSQGYQGLIKIEKKLTSLVKEFDERTDVELSENMAYQQILEMRPKRDELLSYLVSFECAFDKSQGYEDEDINNLLKQEVLDRLAE